MSKKKENRGVIVTTSRGAVIECLPIAADLEALEENIRANVEWPEKPTYVITDVAGSEAEGDLSQAYIDSGHATDGEKAAWAEYQAALARAEAEFRERRGEGEIRLIAYKGVHIVEGPSEEEWRADCEWMRMTVPDDPRERKLLYFRTAVLGNVLGDLAAIMVGIYKASGYDEGVLNQAEATFRATMGRPGAGAETLDGTESASLPRQRDGLVREPDLDGDRRGAEVGADA